MPRTFAQRVGATPVYKLLQPFVHLFRRYKHAGVPPNHEVTTVRFRDRTIALEHRRWSISDRLAVQQCFGEAQYDLPEGEHSQWQEQLYRDIVKSARKPLIVDCGANIGASVAWFSTRYPEAHIVAIEPAPDNCAFLRKNTMAYDVDIRQAAIGPANGTAFLSHAELGGEMGYEVSDVPTSTSIEVISIDSILDRKPETSFVPFILKVDIEGGEKTLFTGNLSNIERFPFIIVEPHDWKTPGEMISREFFRFHAAAKRDFVIRSENCISVALRPACPEAPRKESDR